jgi:hypothetical protein
MIILAKFWQRTPHLHLECPVTNFLYWQQEPIQDYIFFLGQTVVEPDYQAVESVHNINKNIQELQYKRYVHGDYVKSPRVHGNYVVVYMSMATRIYDIFLMAIMSINQACSIHPHLTLQVTT